MLAYGGGVRVSHVYVYNHLQSYMYVETQQYISYYAICKIH